MEKIVKIVEKIEENWLVNLETKNWEGDAIFSKARNCRPKIFSRNNNINNRIDWLLSSIFQIFFVIGMRMLEPLNIKESL